MTLGNRYNEENMKNGKLNYLHDPDPWVLAEDIPDIDVFFSQIWQSCFVNEFRLPNGKAYKKLLNIQRGNHLWFYFGEQDSRNVGEHIASRIVRTPAFATRINKQIIVWADRLRAFANKVPDTHLSQLSNRKIWLWYQEHDEVHTKYYQWCWIPVGADMFHDNLTNRLKDYLRTKVTKSKVNEYLVTLTQPRKRSLIQIEQEEFLKLAMIVCRDVQQKKIFRTLFKTFQEQKAIPFGLKTHTPEFEQALEERVSHIKDRIKRSILKRVEQHYQTYFYIPFMWVGKAGVHSYDHYLKELVKLIGSGVNPNKELLRIKSEFRIQQAKKQKLMKQLRVEPKWRAVFNEWGDFMVTKIYRRYAQIYALYRMQPILKEISKRIGLSMHEVRFMLKDEVRSALLQKKINRKAIKARTRLAVYYYEKGIEKAYVGKQAQALVKKAEKQIKHQATEITGQVGCVGKAIGTVRIITRPKDMPKMQHGDILVSIATDPDIIPAMKKAAAIVTEQGGVTSHAAIVARELNIPCLIGTKIATKVFKDGDRVEVDATKGVVKKI